MPQHRAEGQGTAQDRAGRCPPTTERDAMTDTTNLRPVLVTTAHRGVFFGYAAKSEDLAGSKNLALTDARNCLYWDASVKGFLGLANTGPNNNCRVGPQADIVLHDVTCVARVSEAAVVAWEAAPWAA